MLVFAALAASACATGTRTAAPADGPAPDSVRRWNLRPVPVSEAYRRALAAGTRSPRGEPGPEY